MEESILTRGADMLGHLEWLIADLKKKAAHTKAEEVEGLSKRLDRICDRLEGLDAAAKSEQEGVENGDLDVRSKGISGLGPGLMESLGRVDEQIRHMTRENAVCSREDIGRLSQLLDALEAEVGDGNPVKNPASKE